MGARPRSMLWRCRSSLLRPRLLQQQQSSEPRSVQHGQWERPWLALGVARGTRRESKMGAGRHWQQRQQWGPRRQWQWRFDVRHAPREHPTECRFRPSTPLLRGVPLARARARRPTATAVAGPQQVAVALPRRARYGGSIRPRPRDAASRRRRARARPDSLRARREQQQWLWRWSLERWWWGKQRGLASQQQLEQWQRRRCLAVPHLYPPRSVLRRVGSARGVLLCCGGLGWLPGLCGGHCSC